MPGASGGPASGRDETECSLPNTQVWRLKAKQQGHPPELCPCQQSTQNRVKHQRISERASVRRFQPRQCTLTHYPRGCTVRPLLLIPG